LIKPALQLINQMSVQVPETFESTAILEEKFCAGAQDAHVESIAEIPPLD